MTDKHSTDPTNVELAARARDEPGRLDGIDGQAYLTEVGCRFFESFEGVVSDVDPT